MCVHVFVPIICTRPALKTQGKIVNRSSIKFSILESFHGIFTDGKMFNIYRLPGSLIESNPRIKCSRINQNCHIAQEPCVPEHLLLNHARYFPHKNVFIVETVLWISAEIVCIECAAQVFLWMTTIKLHWHIYPAFTYLYSFMHKRNQMNDKRKVG